MRVLPLSPLLVAGFAGAAVYMGFVAEAAALLVGFDAMLKSGELYHLRIVTSNSSARKPCSA